MSEQTKRFDNANILKLQEERLLIQKKTFTKWMNAHLKRADMSVENLFVDLADGKILLKLMEVISGEQLGKPNRGILRVQKIENVNLALKFIQSKVTLENIGAEDIVDGSPRLILGLIWTIILRFQIQEMMIDGENESGDKISAKESLLLWCQQKTRGYKNVNVKDFSKSWKNGVAFNALVHSQCPDLIDFDKIVPEEHQKNLTQAFLIAENELGVPSLLDPEDVDVDRPDDKSILTYISSLYMTFAKIKNENTSAKRVGKIMSNVVEVSQMIEDYEMLVRKLIKWTQCKITELDNRDFPNSLASLQTEMHKFKEYLTIEKRPKFADRAEIDEKLFQIIIKQKQYQMKLYIPSEGLLLKEVEVAWDSLVKAEHERELALRAELVRQENLEKTAEIFIKKAHLRESWLNEMFSILSKIDTSGQSNEVESNVLKLIGNEVSTSTIQDSTELKKERFQILDKIIQDLEDNNYHDKDMIFEKNVNIQLRWRDLQNIMAKKKSSAEILQPLQVLLTSIYALRLEFDGLYPQIKSSDFGKHFMAAEDLIERHNLVDHQLKVLSGRFKNLESKSQNVIQSLKADSLSEEQKCGIERELNKLNDDINDLLNVSQDRKDLLLKNCNFHNIWSNLDEEEAWLTNEIKMLNNKTTSTDLLSVLRQIKRHKAYESEIVVQRSNFDKLNKLALNLMKDYPLSAGDIQKRIDTLSNGWIDLENVKVQRRIFIKDSYECQKYYTDGDEAKQWMTDHFPLAQNTEYGKDVGTSKALAKRHESVLEKIVIFGQNDITRLKRLATLMTVPLENHSVKLEDITPRVYSYSSLDESIDVTNNLIQISVEEESEDDAKHNEEFVIETSDQKHGFPNARKKIEKQQSFKKKLVNKWVSIDSEDAIKYIARESRKSVNDHIFKAPQPRKANELHYDKENIEKRQHNIDSEYENLIEITKARSINLQSTILCHEFLTGCHHFETWMRDKESSFNARDSLGSDMEGVLQKYEVLNNEFAANSGRINDIDCLVEGIVKLSQISDEGMVKSNCEQLAKIPFPLNKIEIKQRHEEIKRKWDQLNELKCEKERSLKGASSIEMFNKTFLEVAESTNQKLETLEDSDLGVDKESNEALQRKLQHSLREVENINEKIEQLNNFGDEIKKTYPSENEYINGKIDDIKELQDKLQDAVNKRKLDLKNSFNMHKFLDDARGIGDKLNDLGEVFENPIIPKDIQSIEYCIQQHNPHNEEIEAAEASLQNLVWLASQVSAERLDDETLANTIDKLKDKIKNLQDEEKDRVTQLNHLLEEQRFCKECDQIEFLVAQQANKFDAVNPQESVADVERSMKEHEGLRVCMLQLDNRVQSLLENKQHHISSNNLYKNKISDKWKNVEDKMNNLQNKCDQKKYDLENELKFVKFKESANELNEWVDDMTAIIIEDNYKDLKNLSNILPRHKGLEAEIQANASAVEEVSRRGEELINDNHPKKNEINNILNELNQKWENLNYKTDDKEKKILQALDQSDFNDEVNEIMRMAETIETGIMSVPLGDDLYSSRNLINRKNNFEEELTRQKEKLERLKEEANNMIKNDHFGTNRILDNIKKMEKRFSELDPIAKDRNKDLQDNLKYHQFTFDVNKELRWIEQHRPLALLNDCGRSLDNALKFKRNHKKLLNELSNHQPSIDTIIDQGSTLVYEISPEYQNDIKSLCKNLMDDWKILEKQTECRQHKIECTEEGWYLFDDCSEIDSWISEKLYYVNESHQNTDMDHIINRISKLKNIKIDFGTYEALLKEVGNKINLFNTKYCERTLLPELIEGVERKYNDVSEKLYFLEESINNQQKSVEDYRDYQNCKSDGEDLKSWIHEKVIVAESEEYGDDLQKMESLRDRWNYHLTSINGAKDLISAFDKYSDLLLMKSTQYSKDIESLKTDINQKWNHLLDCSSRKNNGFESAKETFEFNQRCKEISDLMDLKIITCSPIHCKDRKTLTSYIRKHEALEYELDNIKTQAENINSDAMKLQKDYPSDLVDKWETLRELSNERFVELQDTQSYLELGDEIKLAQELFSAIKFEMQRDCNIHSVLGAEEELKLANEFKNKLNAKDEYYKKLVACANEMVIKPKCTHILEIRKGIESILEEKDEALTSVNEWIVKSETALIQQKILRDIQQINSSTSSQEAKIKGNFNTLDLEETERIMNENRHLSYTISITDDRLKCITALVETLQQEGRVDMEYISADLDDCKKRRRELNNHNENIKRSLHDQLSWLKFLRETDDLKVWIDEKSQQLKSFDHSTNNIKDKLRLLQKYNEHETEIKVNQKEVERLGNILNEFINNSHRKNNEMNEIYANITTTWAELINEYQLRSTAFNETKDLLFFFDELDAVEDWIREKELIVSANDLGIDLDHCQSLRDKLNEPVRGKQMNNERISEIRAIAEDIMKQKTISQNEANETKERNKSIENRWNGINLQMEEYKKALDKAHNMHNYYNDLCFLEDQINDRLMMVKIKDLGTDIYTVNILKRKQESVGRDIAILKVKFQELKEKDSFEDNLGVDHTIRISMKQKDIKDNLNILSSLAVQRTELLNLSQRYFKLNLDVDMLVELSHNYTSIINSDMWPTNVVSANEAIRVNEQILVNMNTKSIKEKRVTKLIYNLMIDRDDIEERIVGDDISIIPTKEQLTSIQSELQYNINETDSFWKIRNDALIESLQLYTFVESCEVENQLLEIQEKSYASIIKATYSNINSLEDIREIVDTKLSIDSIVSGSEAKVLKGSLLKSLETLRENMIKDLDTAEKKYGDLVAKLKHFKEDLNMTQNTLMAKRQFLELLQRVSDHISWIKIKTVVAADNNYQDKINITSKIKKHKEFMSEMKANEPNICSTMNYGKRLIEENNVNNEEIESKISELENAWKHLLSFSDLRLTRLNQTKEEILWFNQVKEFSEWLDNVEDFLMSPIYGEDLTIVEALKRKNKDIEIDIEFHKEQIECLQAHANIMISNNHYNYEDINAQETYLTNKFQKLSESLSFHALNLADMESLQQFTSDLNYEFDWINDKLMLSKKTELGSNMTEAIQFEKQHSYVMSEINGRSSVVTTLIERGQALENRSHFAAEKIGQMYKGLETAYSDLCRSSKQRSTDLINNLSYQDFDGRIKDINLRISDRVSVLNNFDHGDNEGSCQHLMKRIDGITLEISSENNNFDNIQKSSELLSAEYRESVNESLKTLDQRFEEVNKIMKSKRHSVIENLKYYQFSRDSEELLQWIETENILAEEYGSDYNECMGIIDKHIYHTKSINANASKIIVIKILAEQLISEKNPFSQEIDNRIALLSQNMIQLQENLKIKKEALDGALEVHLFTQESIDLQDWIQMKKIEISSMNKDNIDRIQDIENESTYSDNTGGRCVQDILQPQYVIRMIENYFSNLERELEDPYRQIEILNNESIRLYAIYRDSKDHISKNKDGLEKAWNKLTNVVEELKESFSEFKALQSWLIQYKDLFDWVKVHNEKITAEESLPMDLNGAEQLLIVYNLQKLDIDLKIPQLDQLMKTGDEMKSAAKYIVSILEVKQVKLMNLWDNMRNNLDNRRTIYEENLDLRKLLFDIHHLEKWVISNENKMESVDDNSLKNIDDFEEAVKNHDDFTKYVFSEQEKFDAINRSTKLEEKFKERLALESKETHNKKTQNLGHNGTSQLSEIEPTQSEASDLPVNKHIRQLNGDAVDEGDQTLNDTKYPKRPAFSIKRVFLPSPTVSNYMISGIVKKKQKKTTKGIKASVRSWKQFFAVLEGSNLQLYRNEDVYLNQPAFFSFSGNIKNAVVSVHEDTTKKPLVIRLVLEDLSEFFLQLENKADMENWMTKLNQNSEFQNDNITDIKGGPNAVVESNVDTLLTIPDVSRVIKNNSRRISTSSCDDDS